MRMRLTMSEPETANSSTIGCSVKPASTTCPNQRDSPNAFREAAANINITSSSDVGMGVPSNYSTLPEPSDSASAVML